MIRSMTGYGESERDSPVGRLRLEVKTVNHRFFNASVKTPARLEKFERDIIAVIKQSILRGHVRAVLTVESVSGGEESSARVDIGRAKEVREALEVLRSELELPGDVDLGMMARFGELFRSPETNHMEVIEADWIRELSAQVAKEVCQMREAEGERLRSDIESSLASINEVLNRAEERAPIRLVMERDRLRKAIKELTDDARIDEDRLAREIAYLTEKWDINEEIVRFRSHVELFLEAIEADGSEPVGKRLSFLVQEMHREANTIGSKANDLKISHMAVTLKEDVERIREQVENVE